jgi:hypothetical protein
MNKLLIILFTICLFFSACKKENKSPDSHEEQPSQNPNSTVDFTITPSIVDFPVGTTWGYSVTTVDYQYVNLSSANPNLVYSYTTNATYTVNVVRDTIIFPNITGKILLTSGAGIDNVNTYIREVWYYDSSDVKWHNIFYEKYNGGAEIVGCLGINLPLTSTSAWQNTHASHPSSGIDSCFAKGFDNAICGLGSVKCIKFENKYTGSIQNTYWYNATYGKVRSESSSFTYNGSQTLTGKINTITLISFHN